MDAAVRRYSLVSAVTLLASAVTSGWVLFDLWGGSIQLLRTYGPVDSNDRIYDEQARAMLHGHLSVPNGSIGLEGFVHGGRTYTYFGIFPSLVRMPLLVFTHSLDGRLTAPSIGLAWVVTATFASLLLWRIRTVTVGAAAPLGWSEALSQGALLFSVTSGSVLLFLASRPEVYTEDLAWSVALACASLFCLLGVAERPSGGRIVAAGVLVTLTNLNRSTTGYACVAATFALAAWLGAGRHRAGKWRSALLLAAAGAVALGAGCAVDLAKFGLLFGFPAGEQLLFRALHLQNFNRGHYFGARFLPITLAQYVDPTNIRLSSIFPYVTLPDLGTGSRAIDNELFFRAPAAAATATMPLLVLAGLWGTVAAFARRGTAALGALRILLAATVVTAGAVMVFGWIDERFVADLLPVAILAGSIGMVDIWRRLAGRPKRLRAGAFVLVVLVGLFEALASLGVAVTPTAAWTQVQAAHYVGFQQELSDLTGHPLTRDVRRGTSLPLEAPMGELFDLQGCRSLYVDDGEASNFPYGSVWVRVERAPDTPICRSLAVVARPEARTARVIEPHSGRR